MIGIHTLLSLFFILFYGPSLSLVYAGELKQFNGVVTGPGVSRVDPLLQIVEDDDGNWRLYKRAGAVHPPSHWLDSLREVKPSDEKYGVIVSNAGPIVRRNTPHGWQVDLSFDLTKRTAANKWREEVIGNINYELEKETIGSTKIFRSHVEWVIFPSAAEGKTYPELKIEQNYISLASYNRQVATYNEEVKDLWDREIHTFLTENPSNKIEITNGAAESQSDEGVYPSQNQIQQRIDLLREKKAKILAKAYNHENLTRTASKKMQLLQPKTHRRILSGEQLKLSRLQTLKEMTEQSESGLDLEDLDSNQVHLAEMMEKHRLNIQFNLEMEDLQDRQTHSFLNQTPVGNQTLDLPEVPHNQESVAQIQARIDQLKAEKARVVGHNYDFEKLNRISLYEMRSPFLSTHRNIVGGEHLGLSSVVNRNNVVLQEVISPYGKAGNSTRMNYHGHTVSSPVDSVGSFRNAWQKYLRWGIENEVTNRLVLSATRGGVVGAVMTDSYVRAGIGPILAPFTGYGVFGLGSALIQFYIKQYGDFLQRFKFKGGDVAAYLITESPFHMGPLVVFSIAGVAGINLLSPELYEATLIAVLASTGMQGLADTGISRLRDVALDKVKGNKVRGNQVKQAEIGLEAGTAMLLISLFSNTGAIFIQLGQVLENPAVLNLGLGIAGIMAPAGASLWGYSHLAETQHKRQQRGESVTMGQIMREPLVKKCKDHLTNREYVRAPRSELLY